MKALIKDNEIVQIDETGFVVHPSLIWVDCPDDCTTEWSYENGQFIAPVPYQPTEKEVLEGYTSALSYHFDAVARQKYYDNTASIVSYYASTNPIWAQESQTFVAWRDACWIVALQTLEEVQTGQRAAPSVEQFLNELPIINWL